MESMGVKVRNNNYFLKNMFRDITPFKKIHFVARVVLSRLHEMSKKLLDNVNNKYSG